MVFKAIRTSLLMALRFGFAFLGLFLPARQLQDVIYPECAPLAVAHSNHYQLLAVKFLIAMVDL